MSSKRKIILCLLFILIFMLGLVTVNYFINKNKQRSEIGNYNEYIINYKFGGEYKIVVTKDKITVHAKEKASCPDGLTTCDDVIESDYEIDFLDENMDIIYDFVEKLFKDKDTNIIDLDNESLNDDEVTIMGSITRNSESELISVNSNYKYRIVLVSNKVYYIHVYGDKIIVHKVADNERFNLNFNKENMDFIYKYISGLFDGDYFVKSISEEEMILRDRMIFQSIIMNDEDILKDARENKNLVFKVSSRRIDCYTPVLEVYDDNTYAWFLESSLEKLPVMGSYSYDVGSIIPSIGNFEANDAGPFWLEDSTGKTYYTYDNNTYLMNFLDTIGIDLDICKIL